jgi:hypothetical protein
VLVGRAGVKVSVWGRLVGGAAGAGEGEAGVCVVVRLQAVVVKISSRGSKRLSCFMA